MWFGHQLLFLFFALFYKAFFVLRRFFVLDMLVNYACNLTKFG